MKLKRKSPSHRGGKPLLTAEEKHQRRLDYIRGWRKRNREKLRLYFAAYRKEHGLDAYSREYYRRNKTKWDERSKRADVIESARCYRQRTKAKRNTARREWDKRNPERAAAIARRSRARCRLQKRAKDKLYRQQKPDICKASIARAKAAKPELYKAISVQSSQRRRARKRALPVERVSWRKLRARDRGRCHLCGLTIDGRITFDHLIPVVRGGAHAEWNLMLAHDRCNKSRGTKQILETETRESAERYIAVRLAAYVETAA